MEDVEAFRRTLPDDSLLKSLDAADLADLLRYAVRRSFRRGDTLCEQGAPGDSLMIVLSGTVKVCIFCGLGKEILLDRLGPGGVIGEIALFDGEPRAATVVAGEPALVLSLQRRDVMPFLASHADVALRIVQALCRKLRRTNALLEDHASLAMAPKLARGLLRLMAGQPAEADGEIRMSQSDIGNYVGLSRENVNRQLRQWVESGIVELGRGRIRLTDRAMITRIAEGHA
ncbi:MAG: Crp/Fnr family transcriptional regulator [Alphaproteobacteria bacterium]